jgi:hypothetical protein
MERDVVKSSEVPQDVIALGGERSDERGKPLDSPQRLIEEIRIRVATLCDALGARAAGYWQVDGPSDRLTQVVFTPGTALDPRVGREFAEVTRIVSLSQKDLGIVAAVHGGEAAISEVENLPEAAGSGRWLRAFGASRSVAVPIRDRSGNVAGVLSLALPGRPPEDLPGLVWQIRDVGDEIVRLLSPDSGSLDSGKSPPDNDF